MSDDGVFAASWLYAAHVSELAAPGAYVARGVRGLSRSCSLATRRRVRPGVPQRLPAPRGSARARRGRDGQRRSSAATTGGSSRPTAPCAPRGTSACPGPTRTAALFDAARRGLARPRLRQRRRRWPRRSRAALGGFAAQTDGFDFESFVPGGGVAPRPRVQLEDLRGELPRGLPHPDRAQRARPLDRGAQLRGRRARRLVPAPGAGEGRDRARRALAVALAEPRAQPVPRLDEPRAVRAARPATSRASRTATSRGTARSTRRSRGSPSCCSPRTRPICEAVQRNLDAGVYERGVLSPRHEQGVALFQRLVRRVRRATSRSQPALGAPGGLDLEALEARDEVRAQPLGGADDLDRVEHRDELLEEHAHLEPREVRAEAQVRAVQPEGDVVVRRPRAASKWNGLVELLGVEVRRHVPDDDLVARRGSPSRAARCPRSRCGGSASSSSSTAASRR